MQRMIFNLQDHQKQVMSRLSRWKSQDFVIRLKKKDASLWPSSTQEEIVQRLGWLTLPSMMKGQTGEICSFRDKTVAECFSHAVLCGMGGSSLAPEVFQAAFGNAPGFPELIVADSTHPQAVESVSGEVDIDRTLFVISSKSGTTLETLSLFRYFWDKIGKRGRDPGRQFVAITDAGTPLHELGLKRRFRKIFLAPPDVGGRFSALSHFGLVAAALIGLDVEKLLEKAEFAAESCADDVAEERLACLYLGAALGEVGKLRDKLTVLTSASLKSFPHWLEQLVAESTGKQGQGIVPVVDEPGIPAGDYTNDRFFVSFLLKGDGDGELTAFLEQVERYGHPVVRIDLREKYGLAQEIFRWEMAVAAAATVLGVNPFDQPDVELAKTMARRAMEGARGFGPKTIRAETFRSGEVETLDAFFSWISQGKERDYFCLQSFLPPGPQLSEALCALRKKILEKTRLASSAGFGPRFLHSTGQMHKGGPGTGLFLQFVDEPQCRVEVPETEFTFNALIRAQALGDYLALRDKGRRVMRIDLGQDAERGIRWLEENI